MAFLNFIDRPIRLERTEHPRFGTALRIGFDSESRARFAEELASLSTAAGFNIGEELRVDLPAGWTLFWKLRDGESRLLLAHPELDQWVATLALARGHAEALSAALAAGGEISVSALAPVSRMGNLEVLIAP